VNVERPVEKIVVQFLGLRGYPIGAPAKLSGPLAEGFPDLVDRAKKINPAVSEIELVRQIFDLGIRKLNANIARGILQEARPAETGP
jgi:hypothetical protein